MLGFKTKKKTLEKKRIAQFQKMELEDVSHSIFFDRLMKKQVLEATRLESTRKPRDYIQ